MDVVWLRHLAYVLMPALTVLWGESLRARFLHRGARRAIRLLLAALLAWQSVRLLKYMAEPAVLDADETLLRLLWYLYYIFRAALPVALLWIAHVADRDAVAQRLPVHLFALLVLNLALAIAILTNDWHEQFFSFPQEREGSDWEEEVEWGAYAYWTLWFLEVFTALAILWIKAKLQKIWRFRMVLPVVCCILFLLYSIFYNFLPAVRIDVTLTTAGFFLLLLELCLRTGLMPSNHDHEVFFREASLGLMLFDARGAVRLVSKAAPEQGARRDCRISKMEVPGGGTLVWYEDMSLLHERQRSLAQANRALERRSRYLRRTVHLRRQQTAAAMHQRLRREVEALLEELRPYFREFREESGTIALEELEMAASEICSALRAFHVHAAITWSMPKVLPAQGALLAFDALVTFLAEAARSRPEQEVYVTMGEKSVTFLVDEHDTWVDRWQSLWQEKHGEGCISCRDLGYAVSVTCDISRGEVAP